MFNSPPHKQVDMFCIEVLAAISALIEGLTYVCVQLHLAAITSMKGELNELRTRLQHVSNERDLLERQVNMSQVRSA